MRRRRLWGAGAGIGVGVGVGVAGWGMVVVVVVVRGRLLLKLMDSGGICGSEVKEEERLRLFDFFVGVGSGVGGRWV